MIGRPFAEHADHRVRLVVDADRLADDGGIAGEAVLPQAVGEDHDLVAAEGAFLLGEGAAERQRMAVAEHPEEARRGAPGADVLGLIARWPGSPARRPRR